MVTGLGAPKRGKPATVCAADALDLEWMRAQPCMTYYPDARADPIRSSKEASTTIRRIIPVDAFAQELVIVLCLDAKNAPVAASLVSMGGATSAAVEVATVLRAPVLLGAVGFIVMHNHPSQDPFPSDDDTALTQRLFKASRVVGVSMLDHIVLASGDPDSYFSYLDNGLLGTM